MNRKSEILNFVARDFPLGIEGARGNNYEINYELQKINYELRMGELRN